MSLNTVTVTWTVEDFAQQAVSGVITFTPYASPNSALTDTVDGLTIPLTPRSYFFTNGTGTSDPLIATDNVNVQPSGWQYTVTVAIHGLAPYSFNTFLAFASGASQVLSSLVPVSPTPSVLQYLPLTGGSLTGPVAMGGNKVTGLANGSAASDAAAFGQVPLIDATVGDIKPVGTVAAAGSVGKAADAGHVHAGVNAPGPTDYGYLAWSWDLAAASSSNTALTAANVYLNRIDVHYPISVTNVCVLLNTVGATLTANQNFAGLYNSSGTLIASTADQSTNWTSATAFTIQEMALAGGPYNLSAGFYWVALLSNGTTPPAFVRGTTASTPKNWANQHLTAATFRYANLSGAQTSLPGSFTPSSNLNTIIQAYWVALT